MRHNRAHLVLSKDKPWHIHDLDPLIPETASMTEAQTKQQHGKEHLEYPESEGHVQVQHLPTI